MRAVPRESPSVLDSGEISSTSAFTAPSQLFDVGNDVKSTAFSKTRKQLKYIWQRRRRAARRPFVESLEDRRLLAGDAWSSLALDGPEGEGGTADTRIPDQLMVAFEHGTTPAVRALIANRFGAEIRQYYDKLETALVQLRPGSNVDSAAAQWTALPEVKLAEPNITFRKQYVPNDPFLNGQWGIHNYGQIPFMGKLDADIDAIEGWDISPGGSPSVIVAVIDSGVDINHPDLRANIFVNPGEIAANLIDDDGNGYIDDVSGWDAFNNDNDVTDLDGHGTHVAGIIGAVGNNAVGIAGVAWKTKILPVKALDPAGSLASILGSLNYVITVKQQGYNVAISTHSYGGAGYSGILDFGFQALAATGNLPVAAAGNGGADGVGDNNDFSPNYPSNFSLPEMFAVAATDWNDDITSFSNFGKASVDIGAPGAQILSTLPVLLGSYDYSDGTSMATPMVAGAAAVLKALEPSLTSLQIKSLLMTSGDLTPAMTGKVVSDRRLNLNNAIQAMPKGAIRGVVYEDVNRNGRRDVGEFGIPNARVFMDLNSNGAEDVGEPYAITGIDGVYNIVNFSGAGTFTVIVAPIPGLSAVSPPGGGRSVTVPGRTDIIPGIDFGFQRPGGGGPSGVVFHDVNANRRQDAGETGIPGAFVWFDRIDNGRLDLGEVAVQSGADGKFSLPEQPTGSYKVRAQIGPGWRQTLPGGTSPYHTIIFGIGTGSAQLVDFGYADGNLLDFGNATAGAKQSALADNGGRYGVLSGFQLGATISGEADAIAADSNDGIAFTSPFFAGGTATGTADVRLGGQSRGLLQAWIDFNQDGDFSDAGEKVVTDLRLGEGVHAISMPIPAGALTGPTQARFRYGWERGMTPDGQGLAGEVEDYTVNIFGDSPQAIDDLVSVDQDSSGNPINPLANDFPSSAGGLKIKSATSPTLRGGTVSLAADKLSLIYTPRPNFFGTDSFNYTIEDNSGKTASGRVTVNVVPTFTAPQAVDDQAAVGTNTPNNAIRVLNNDVLGANPPTRIGSIVRAPAHGTASIDSNGTADPSDDVIRYTPTTNFVGVDQFKYRIVDNVGAFSDATVTVFVGDTFSDDSIRYQIGFTDPATGSPIAQVEVGKSFVVTVTVEDIRTGISPTDMGAFAAYLDLLYPGTMVAVSPPLVFNGAYTDTPEGDTSVPGIINESGAFRTFDQAPPGPGAKVVYRATFRATATGTATFLTDPADDVFDPGPPAVFGNHDTLVYEPASAIAIADISYLGGSINVISGGGGEGERPMHNYSLPTDVNGDRRVNTSDAVSLLAYLNRRASGSGEGEGEVLRNRLYFDTTLDFKVTTRDLFHVLRELASGVSSSAGEGESTTEPLDAPIADPMATVAYASPVVDTRVARSGVQNAPETGSRASSDSAAPIVAQGASRERSESRDAAFGGWTSPSDDQAVDELDDSFFEDVLRHRRN